MCKSVNCEKTSILVSSVGSFFSYVNDVRSHEPEVSFSKFRSKYEGWNFNSGNYLFTTDTK